MKPRKVILRCDSSYKIGSGHLLRCIRLAKYLRYSGFLCCFVCKDLEGNFSDLIFNEGFEKTVIKENCNEIKEIANIIDLVSPEWIILDSYDIHADWESLVKKRGCKLFVFDDTHRKHTTTALFDNNLYSIIPQNYLDSTYEKVFLGPKFTLLAPSFFNLKPESNLKDSVSCVMVFFGGSDISNQTSRFIELFAKESKFKDLKFNVIVGMSNPHLLQIKQLMANRSNFELHIQIADIEKLLKVTDLYIGSGGTITWERAYFGIPAICLTVAENQESIARNLNEAGVHIYMGPAELVNDSDIIQTTSHLIKDFKLREKLQLNSLKLEVGKHFMEIINYFSI
jgi:UDP-2,4-diacetamido-2,4,6-trideoxy-beta-L-altropyranose hydrolase